MGKLIQSGTKSSKSSLRVRSFLFLLGALLITFTARSHSFNRPVVEKLALERPLSSAKHSRSPAAHAKLTSTLSLASLSEIERALDEDSACELFNHPYDQRVLFKALLTRVKNPAIQALFGEDGPMAGSASSESDEINQFYTALLAADLLLSVHPKQLDYANALQILNRLYSQNPSNGAYAYYTSVILSLTGETKERQKEWLEKALQASYFDTYIKEVIESIQADLIQNATQWLAVVSFRSQIPVPAPPNRIFIRALYPNPSQEDSRLITHFGLMLNQNPGSIGLEFITGKKITEEYWSQAYPGVDVPELKSLKSQEDPLPVSSIESLNQAACNRKFLDQDFELAKSHGFQFD